MDRMLYVAMAGAKQTMQAQQVNTHNLANASTTGFREDLTAFQSLPVKGPGLDSRAYTQAQANGVDLSAGARITTGRELDVAVDGGGFIAVQAPDGGEAYTRAGDLRVDPFGQLVTGKGHPVLGNGGPIAVPPSEKLEIGNDGTISIRPVGQTAATLAVVDRIKLVTPDSEQLAKGTDGLLRTQQGGALPADANVRLSSGVLEGSNVNAVESMVNMIDLARQFEMQTKIMKTAKDNDAAASQLLRMS